MVLLRKIRQQAQPVTATANLAYVVILSAFLCAHEVSATPIIANLLRSRQNNNSNSNNSSSSSSNSNSQSGSKSSGVTPQVWIPAVIVVIFLLVIFGLMWTRRGVISRLRWLSSATGHDNNAARELTAEQLSGEETRGQATSTTTPATRNATATPRPRTGARTRRTPSQISTKSLPVYNKEPGDQELVIFRGPEDMEDDDVERNRMPSVDESAETGINIMAMVPLYAVIPVSGNDMPLLHNDSHDNSAVDVNATPYNSTQRLMPSRSRDSDESDEQQQNNENEDVRPSFETTATSTESGSALLGNGSVRINASRVSIGGYDERGEAPPYFEVVPQPDLERTTSNMDGNGSSLELTQSPPGLPTTVREASVTTPAPSTPPASAPSLPTEAGNRRLSGIRNFFGTLGTSQRPPVPPLPSATTPVRGHTRHRSSQSGSGSGSTMNLSAFRPLSRARSNNTLNSLSGHPSSSNLNLTSPSMLSVNSISAPLSHTLVRTEFRYPKGGPTPEQIKLISSRESLAKFAVPYGADAIAHAAQASRVELVPPPEFESPTEMQGEGSEEITGERDAASPENEEFDEEENSMSSGENAIPEESTPAPSSDSHSPETDSVPQHLRPGAAPPSSFRQQTSPETTSRSASRASTAASYATAEETPSPPAPLTINVHAPEPSSASLRTITSRPNADSPATPTMRRQSGTLPGASSRPQSVVGER